MTAAKTEPAPRAKRASTPTDTPQPQHEEQRPPISIGVDAFSEYEQWNMRHRLVVAPHTRAKDLHGTDVWNACADRMTAGDDIYAITSDAKRLFIGIVTAGDRAMSVRSPRVCILHEIALPAAGDVDTGLPPDCRLRLANPGDGVGEGWLGVRQKPGDAEVFITGPHPQRQDAEFALRNHATVRVGARANFV